MYFNLKKIFTEAIYWYFSPLLFLFVYIFNFYNPPLTASKHLYPITLIFITCFLIKLVIFKISENRFSTLVVATYYSIVQYLLFAYYILALISLQSWGKVITIELMVSYLSQINPFLEALEISIYSICLICFLSYIFFFFITNYFIKKSLFLNTISNTKISNKIYFFALTTLLLATTIPLHFYFYIKPFVGNEPFHLTMYAGKDNALDTLEHPIKYDNALALQENTIRNSYASDHSTKKRNVILIVVDALRPDHMGVYGYSRDTTPHLSNLDKQGVMLKFNHVRASCGASACGLSTLATARFAHQIPENPFTLSQVLASNGYSTQIILSGDHTNFYNLRSIYGKVDTYYDGSMASPYYMNDDALIINKLNTLNDFNGQATFFQFHLMSSHGLSKHLTEFETFKPSKGYSGNIRGAPSFEHINYYDNGIIQTDFYIKNILATLDKKKYLKDALVVITADHGESLGEHNMYSHANSVHEVLLRIPFLLINARNKNPLIQRTSSFVSQADIAPTVLYELELQTPTNWAGTAVQLQASNSRNNTYTFFQLHPRVGMYIHGDTLWKYWLNTYNSEEFVFNLSKDPQEQKNLITEIDTQLRLKYRKQIQETRTE